MFEQKDIVAQSEGETSKLAREFAANLMPGDVVAFWGELGTGKTFFIKQISNYLQTKEQATSPSFTIINEYTTTSGFKIFHFDFYRIENEAELQHLGLEEYLFSHNVCLIEWAEKIEEFLPFTRYDIYLDFVESKPQARHIRIYKR
jgi:tRNA threonylcarbamoyladenosine biosynthesis protein TsaE